MVDLTGYKLTFDDEFNTRSISQTGANTTYADIRPGSRYDANSDIGFGKSSFVDPSSGYDPFSVQNGALSITAVPDRTSSGYPGSWESGLITTQGKFSQEYGYFEIRADFSNQPGAWDAFWMGPDHQVPDPNQAGGWQELDVVEHYGSNAAGVYSTIHTTDPQNGIPWQANRQVYSEMPNPSGYHTYGVNWQSDKMSFYVDGQLTGSQATPSDMHGPMYMMADLAIQDGASGSPISSHIDYIRAYSNDPNAVAVAQDKVSAPDGKDPGLYGATAASAKPATGATDAVTSSGGTGASPVGTTSSADSTASSTGMANPVASGSAASGSGSVSASTGGVSPTAGSPMSPSGATAPAADAVTVSAGTGASPAGTTSGADSTASSTGMANPVASGSMASGSGSVAASTGGVSQTAGSPVSTTSGATASAAATGSTTKPSPVSPETAVTGTTTPTQPSGVTPASATTSTAHTAGSQHGPAHGKTLPYGTFRTTDQQRAAFMASMQKINDHQASPPETSGWKNKFLDMFHHYW